MHSWRNRRARRRSRCCCNGCRCIRCLSCLHLVARRERRARVLARAALAGRAAWACAPLDGGCPTCVVRDGGRGRRWKPVEIEAAAPLLRTKLSRSSGLAALGGTQWSVSVGVGRHFHSNRLPAASQQICQPQYSIQGLGVHNASFLLFMFLLFTLWTPRISISVSKPLPMINMLGLPQVAD